MNLEYFAANMVTFLLNITYTMCALFIGLIAIKFADSKLLKSVNLEEEIKRGNVAAAIFASTLLVFVAIIVSSGLKG